MKKLVILFTLCFLSLVSFAQNTAQTTKESLVSGKDTKSYTFILPDSKTAADVDGVKGYYKNEIAVSFDAQKHVMTVKLLDTQEINYRVMGRLLVALNCRTISVDGNDMTFDEVYDTYMN